MKLSLKELLSSFKSSVRRSKPKTWAFGGFGSTPSVSFSAPSRDDIDKYLKVYYSQNIVFASIETIVQNAILTGYSFYSNNDEALERVRQFCKRTGLIEVKFAENTRNALICGDGFAENVLDEDGYLYDLYTRDPRTIEIVPNDYGEIVGYVQVVAGQRSDIIPPELITHFQFFSRVDSPYGLSIIAPSYKSIVRKEMVDEATATAVVRHGHPKYIIKLLGMLERGKYLINEEVKQAIRNELTNLDARKEIMIPDAISIENIDVKGVQNVEEYFNYFTQLVTAGLLVPEEAVGLGRNITEACYSEDTETLTLDGWKPLSKLSQDDFVLKYDIETGKVYWTKPKQLLSFPYKGKMIHIKSKYVDILVTPKHRFWVCRYPYHKNAKREWKIVEAQDLLHGEWAIKIKASGFDGTFDHLHEFEREQIEKYGIDFIRFIGLFIAEGSLRPNAKNYEVSVCHKKETYINEIKTLFEHIGFRSTSSENKGVEWYIIDKELWNYLTEYGLYSYERRIPKRIKELPVAYLKELIKWIAIGDGSINDNRFDISTTSQQLADDIVEIAIKCGYKVSVREQHDKRGNRKIIYRISIVDFNKDFTLIIGEKNVKEVDYDGYVYSFDLDGGFYVTRRNGKVAFQGNTSHTKIVMFERFISAIQTKLSFIFENQIVPLILRDDFPPDVYVGIRFKGITEKDEAVKARWLSSLLSAYKGTGVRPFTINEIRDMFGYPPIDGGDTVFVSDKRK